MMISQIAIDEQAIEVVPEIVYELHQSEPAPSVTADDMETPSAKTGAVDSNVNGDVQATLARTAAILAETQRSSIELNAKIAQL